MRVISVFFVLLLSMVFSAPSYSENSEPNSSQNANALSEKTKQDIEKLKQSVEDLRKSTEEAKASDALNEKVAPFLMEELKVLLKEAKYDEVKKVLNKWGAIYPHEAQIPLWRDLVANLEKEPDQKRKKELYREVTGLMAAYVERLRLLEIMKHSLDEEKILHAPEFDLCKAVARKDKIKIEELLAKGVSANAKDSFGETALSYATLQGNVDIAKLLLSHGANVNEKGLLDSTVLIFAASKGHAELVRVLLSAGADVNAKTKTGVTALRAAKINGYSDVVELLKQAGAKE